MMRLKEQKPTLELLDAIMIHSREKNPKEIFKFCNLYKN